MQDTCPRDRSQVREGPGSLLSSYINFSSLLNKGIEIPRAQVALRARMLQRNKPLGLAAIVDGRARLSGLGAAAGSQTVHSGLSQGVACLLT